MTTKITRKTTRHPYCVSELANGPREWQGVEFIMSRTKTDGRFQSTDHIEVVRYGDGSIAVTRDDQFVYFYPDQVRELRRIIGLPTPRKPAKRRKE